MKKTFCRPLSRAAWAVLALGSLPFGIAQADDPAAPPAKWADTLKFSAQIDIGGNYNTDADSHHENFGRLYDDKANTVLLNQVLLTATRPIDPAAPGYDFGFKLQGMYGSDARYTRPPHEFSNILNTDLNQIDLAEANLQAHTPWLTEGGVDWKVGRFTSPEGAETLDPSTNYFYSHSYIYNFGIPTQGTGLLTTWHATPMFDIYAGFDTGVNTSVDHGLNHALNGGTPAIDAGLGVNLLDGKLTVLALTHAGPENAPMGVPQGTDATAKYRELSDIVTTWKATDKLTLVNELNWIHDDVLAPGGKAADGFGIAQYAAYALTDTVTLVGRGEIFRDVKGVFVGQAASNGQFVAAEAGQASLALAGSATYGEITLGVNYKPELGLPLLSSLLIRPEVRYDDSLGNAKPFNGSNADSGMLTVAVDAVVTF